MAKITYDNKVSLNPQPSIADINKVTDADMNEIKASVNDNCTYSTNEICVGEWIDGKPLYRKVYNLTSITSSNTDLFDITGLSISKAVKLYGMIYTTAASFPMPLTDSSSNYSVIFLTQTAIRGRAVIGSGSFVSGWIAIEYTKTTD